MRVAEETEVELSSEASRPDRAFASSGRRSIVSLAARPEVRIVALLALLLFVDLGRWGLLFPDEGLQALQSRWTYRSARWLASNFPIFLARGVPMDAEAWRSYEGSLEGTSPFYARPAMDWFGAAALALGGDADVSLMAANVVAASVLVLLLSSIARRLGVPPGRTALWLALTPFLTFYARRFIPEILGALFQVLAVRLLLSARRPAHSSAAGAAAALAFLSHSRNQAATALAFLFAFVSPEGARWTRRERIESACWTAVGWAAPFVAAEAAWHVPLLFAGATGVVFPHETFLETLFWNFKQILFYVRIFPRVDSGELIAAVGWHLFRWGGLPLLLAALLGLRRRPTLRGREWAVPGYFLFPVVFGFRWIIMPPRFLLAPALGLSLLAARAATDASPRLRRVLLALLLAQVAWWGAAEWSYRPAGNPYRAAAARLLELDAAGVAGFDASILRFYLPRSVEVASSLPADADRWFVAEGPDMTYGLMGWTVSEAQERAFRLRGAAGRPRPFPAGAEVFSEPAWLRSPAPYDQADRSFYDARRALETYPEHLGAVALYPAPITSTAEGG